MNKLEQGLLRGLPKGEAADFYVRLKTAGWQDLPDEVGVLEGQFAAPLEQVVAKTMEVAAAKFRKMTAYYIYGESMRGLAQHTIGEQFREHAQQELAAAEAYMKRAATLGGGPTHLPAIDPPPASSDPVDIIQRMARAEQEGIAAQRELRALVGEENPFKVQIENFLVEDQHHLDELWQLLPQEQRHTPVITQAPAPVENVVPSTEEQPLSKGVPTEKTASVVELTPMDQARELAAERVLAARKPGTPGVAGPTLLGGASGMGLGAGLALANARMHGGSIAEVALGGLAGAGLGLSAGQYLGRRQQRKYKSGTQSLASEIYDAVPATVAKAKSIGEGRSLALAGKNRLTPIIGFDPAKGFTTGDLKLAAEAQGVPGDADLKEKGRERAVTNLAAEAHREKGRRVERLGGIAGGLGGTVGGALLGKKYLGQHGSAVGAGLGYLTGGKAGRELGAEADIAKNASKSQEWVSDKIRLLKDEGKPQKQAVAIALRMAGAPKPKTASAASTAIQRVGSLGSSASSTATKSGLGSYIKGRAKMLKRRAKELMTGSREDSLKRKAVDTFSHIPNARSDQEARRLKRHAANYANFAFAEQARGGLARGAAGGLGAAALGGALGMGASALQTPEDKRKERKNLGPIGRRMQDHPGIASALMLAPMGATAPAFYRNPMSTKAFAAHMGAAFAPLALGLTDRALRVREHKKTASSAKLGYSAAGLDQAPVSEEAVPPTAAPVATPPVGPLPQMAAPPGSQKLQPANYLEAERAAQEAEQQNAANYYRHRMQGAMQAMGGMQSQIQDVQGQLDSLSQQSAETHAQVAERTQQAIDANIEATHHAQQAANMRIGLEKLRQQMMEVASQDPETLAQPEMGAMADQGLGTGLPEETGVTQDPNAGTPAAEQAPGTTVAGAPGPTAVAEPQNASGVSGRVADEGAINTTKVADVKTEVTKRLPWAALGGGAGALSGATAGRKLSEHQEKVRSLSAPQTGGNYEHTQALAKAYSDLAAAEKSKKVPARAALGGGLTGAVLMGATGPRLAESGKRLIKNIAELAK